MKERILTEEIMKQFRCSLLEEEKSCATVEKYIRDVSAFKAFASNGKICKGTVIAYKQKLMDRGYAVRSVNSMLASLNSLFRFLNWADCKIKAAKVQRQIYCSEEKELTKAEYIRLCRAAKENETNACISFCRPSAAQEYGSANSST